MTGRLRALGENLVRTRADRAGLIVFAALVGLFAALALLGRDVGAWGLLFMAGGSAAWVLLAVTDRSRRWRKPAALATVLSFPAWAALGALSLWIPALEALGPSVDLEPGPGAFVRGAVMVGAILGLMKLWGPEERR